MPGPDPSAIADLAGRVRAVSPIGRRVLVAVAGPPGSGKSTLAEALVAALGAEAALVPMDGFHLDNRVLDSRGLRARKGAPETFDGVGFLHAVERLAAEEEVVLPVFDRTRDIAIAGCQVVGPNARIAVVEGNYLLLRRKPWARLRGLWDFSVRLEVPEEELLRRLIQRWLDHGHDAAAAEARARSNDLPNARVVAAESLAADLVV